jgi:proline dehydrogenase
MMLNIDRLYRSAVLGVSNNPLIKNVIRERARGAVRRFVAGETLPEAITAVERLEQDGIHGILDLLGEMVNSDLEANAFTAQILEICAAYEHWQAEHKTFPGYISIKLSQLGLDRPGDLGFQNARQILVAAQRTNAFVRIDMEDSPRVAKTLEVFRELRGEFDNVGLVLQAMLRRSESDLASLADLKPNLRIVKGAYLEPESEAFPEKHTVDLQYRRLVYRNLELGHYTCIATHDESIIKDCQIYIERNKIPKDRYEFQMLYGIRRDLQKRLASEGFTVRAYIPYGKDWYAYFSRRIAERPANVGFVLRGMFKG